LLTILFTLLICLQFLMNTFHDWVHIPGWTHGRQVASALGPVKMWLGTLFNLVLSGPAAGFAIYYWHRPKPSLVMDYWIAYCAFTVFGAIMGWWVLYFRGADEKTKDLYAKMYSGTLQVLPPRGDNPRPNLFHLYLHALFLITLGLAIALRAQHS
jgi:hypothetical protein